MLFAVLGISLVDDRLRDMGAVKGGGGVLFIEGSFLGEGAVKRTAGATGARGNQQPGGLTAGDGFKEGIGHALGLVHHHEQGMASVVFGVPAFGPSWVGGRVADDAGSVAVVVEVADLARGDFPAGAKLGDSGAQAWPELGFDLTEDASRGDSHAALIAKGVPEEGGGDDGGGFARAVGGTKRHAGLGLLQVTKHLFLPRIELHPQQNLRKSNRTAKSV